MRMRAPAAPDLGSGDSNRSFGAASTRSRAHRPCCPRASRKCVTMFGDESFDCERGPPRDFLDKIVGAGEHAIRMIDGDLAEVLHQELATGPARDAVGLGIQRPGIVARRSS